MILILKTSYRFVKSLRKLIETNDLISFLFSPLFEICE